MPPRLDIGDVAATRKVQDRIRVEFMNNFNRGYATVGTRKTSIGTEYLLVPWSDF